MTYKLHINSLLNKRAVPMSGYPFNEEMFPHFRSLRLLVKLEVVSSSCCWLLGGYWGNRYFRGLGFPANLISRVKSFQKCAVSLD